MTLEKELLNPSEVGAEIEKEGIERKELIDKVLSINKSAEEKIQILRDIAQGGRSEYLSQTTFPEELASLVEGRVNWIFLKETTKEKTEDIDKRIEEFTDRFDKTQKRYFLDRENPELKEILSRTTEELLDISRKAEEEWSKLSLEEKRRLSEKLSQKMMAEKNQLMESLKSQIKEIEKKELEKDEFFALVSSLREEFSDRPFAIPREKIVSRIESIEKNSNKEIAEHLPEIIKFTNEEQIKNTVEKVYKTPGRKGWDYIMTYEEAEIYSELTGLDKKTLKDILGWVKYDSQKEVLRGEWQGDEYHKLNKRYDEARKRLYPHFHRLVTEDRERLNTLVKGELRGKDAEEAFEIGERVQNLKEELGNREVSGLNLKEIYRSARIVWFEPEMLFKGLSEERPTWLCEPILVYYDPEKEFVYTDKSVLPEEVKKRVEARIGYKSQSRRTHYILNNDGIIVIVNGDFKGHSPPDLEGREIVESSGAPEGILNEIEGRREAAILNKIGAIEAEFVPVNKAKDIKGREITYGVLRRKAKPGVKYTPFIRMTAPSQIIEKMAEYEKISSKEFIDKAAANFAKELDKLHQEGIFDGNEYEPGKYKSWNHSGNLTIDGHMVDVGSTSVFEEIAGESFDPENLKHFKILNLYKTKDIDRFFGGDREAKESADIGFYAIKFEKGPPEMSKETLYSLEFIPSFIENYLSELPDQEREKIFEELSEVLKDQKRWPEKASEILAQAHTEMCFLKKIKK